MELCFEIKEVTGVNVNFEYTPSCEQISLAIWDGKSHDPLKSTNDINGTIYYSVGEDYESLDDAINELKGML